jgi:hypothetical protein
MSTTYLYYYKNSNQKRSKLFVILGVVSILLSSILYIVGLFIDLNSSVFIVILGLVLISILMFILGWISYKKPAIYEAMVTPSKLIIKYPNIAELSFDLKIADIKSFEKREIENFIGKSETKFGVVLKNGYFYQICTKHGNSIDRIFEAIKSINPDVRFIK